MLRDLFYHLAWYGVAFTGIFFALTFAYCWKSANDLRVRSFALIVSCFFLFSVGGALYLAQFVRQKSVEKMEDVLIAYTKVINHLGDSQLEEILEIEREWLKANPQVDRIFTFKKSPENTIALASEVHRLDLDDPGHHTLDPYPLSTVHLSEIFDLLSVDETKTLKEVVTGGDSTWMRGYARLLNEKGRMVGGLGIDFSTRGHLDSQRELLSVFAVIFLGAYCLFLVILQSRAKINLSRRELTSALQEAEKAKDTKSKFLATISHEIRTPLNGILGAAELVKDATDPSLIKQYLGLINSCGNQLLELVNDVLDFSKLESHAVQIEKLPLNLRELLQTCMEILRVRAMEKNLSLVFEDHLGGEYWMLGDPTRLRQIILNLLSNAIKFTKIGSVTLRAERIKDTTHDSLRISVIDTGMGISEENLSKLFLSFSQVDASTTRKFGGTGLGLAICRGLVELMAGTVQVQSKLGQGSNFSFTIPFQPVPISEKGNAAEADATFQDVDQLDLRVLIVDDNEVNRTVLSKVLERLGLQSSQAKNGKELLDLVASRSFDLIFLDGHMPIMDGFEAAGHLAELRKAGKFHASVVAVTADAELETRQRFKKMGVENVLFKPISVEKVSEQVLTAIEVHSVKRGDAA